MDGQDKGGFFSKIETPWQAKVMVADSAKVIYIFSILSLIPAAIYKSLFHAGAAIVLAVGGYLIAKYSNRFASIFVIVWGVFNLGLGLMDHAIGGGAALM